MTKYAKTLLIAGVCALLAMGSTYVAFGATSLDDAASKSQDNAFSAITNWFKKGVKIGDQGVGGVTQFNGTIINDTTTSGRDNPVTIGDNLRVDGKISRGPLDASKPVWVTGGLKVEGNVQQGRSDYGVLKAAYSIRADGMILHTVDNTGKGELGISGGETAVGTYTYRFSYDMRQNYAHERFFVISPTGTSTAPIAASWELSNNQNLTIHLVNVKTGADADADFQLMVY